MESSEIKQKLGLALSGGGYRAAAFHLGVLRRLHDKELLDKIDIVSTISGGSIAGACYVLNKKEKFPEFEKKFTAMLQKSVIFYICTHWRLIIPLVTCFVFLAALLYSIFCCQLPPWKTGIAFGVLLLIFWLQFYIFPLTALKIQAYKCIFFGKNKISDLPEKPLLAINASNLATGTMWTFSKLKCTDSSYEYPKDKGAEIKFDCGDMPVAVAVASSTCVPILFGPVHIKKKYFQKKEDYKRARPMLIDGGVYDNQGIHKISHEKSLYKADILIVSDGSMPFGEKFKTFNSGFILYRSIDVMMRKIKNMQFIRDVYGGGKEIAYFSIDWRYKRCVEGFVDHAKEGRIPKTLLQHHAIDDAMLKQPKEWLVDYMLVRIEFDRITADGLKDENGEIKTAAAIGTNLTALSTREIDLLSRHGATLVELQVALYCPSLATLSNTKVEDAKN